VITWTCFAWEANGPVRDFSLGRDCWAVLAAIARVGRQVVMSGIKISTEGLSRYCSRGAVKLANNERVAIRCRNHVVGLGVSGV